MSAPELIIRYLRQRARPRVFVPLALLTGLTSAFIIQPPALDPRAIALAAAHAFALALVFRIWDDLEDRDVDRVRHPARVMTSAATPAPFYAFAFALSAACVFALAQLPDAMRRLEAVSIAAGILSIWYAARPSENYNRPFGETILSIKYPLIAYAVAPTLPVDGLSFRAIALLGGLYAIVCAYAYADDPELRHSFTSWRSIP